MLSASPPVIEGGGCEGVNSKIFSKHESALSNTFKICRAFFISIMFQKISLDLGKSIIKEIVLPPPKNIVY